MRMPFNAILTHGGYRADAAEALSGDAVPSASNHQPPRPEVRHYVNYWTPEQMRVLDVVRALLTRPASSFATRMN